MEIRRIEGIIPLEGLSRDLPLKLENFSFHDMKKLLSTISSGSSKKDLKEEFESLLIKATFEGYTSEGKAKLRSGKLLLIADVEVNREFKVGEELIFKLKSLFPKIELSLVNDKVMKTLSLIKNLLSSFSAEGISKCVTLLKNPAYHPVIVSYISTQIPELREEVEKFLKEVEKGFIKNPSLGVLALLSLLEEKKVDRKTVKEAIHSLMVAFGFYVATSLIVVPFLFEEEFKGAVFFPKKGELNEIFVEIDTGKGKLAVLLRAIGKDFTLEFFTDSTDVKEKLLGSEEVLKEELKKEGFNLLYLKFAGSYEKGEERKREYFKGEKGITVNYSV